MDSAKNKFLLISFGQDAAFLPKLSEPKSYLHYVSEPIDGVSLFIDYRRASAINKNEAISKIILIGLAAGYRPPTVRILIDWRAVARR